MKDEIWQDEEPLYRRSNHLMQVAWFGVGCLTITEAAELAAIDMSDEDVLPWPEAPNDWREKGVQGFYRRMLEKPTRELEKRIISDISSGQLQVESLRKNFIDGTVNPNETYLTFDQFAEWLHLYGHEYGQTLAAWIENEKLIAPKVLNELKYQRAATWGDSFEARYIQQSETHELEIEYKKAMAEVNELRKQLRESGLASPQNSDDSLKTRERNTYLKVISALSRQLSLDLGERGAAQRIAQITEQSGDPVGRDTIAKMLKKIQESL